MAAYIADGLRGAVSVQEFIGRRIYTHQLFAAGFQQLEPRNIGIGYGHLSGHLSGHETMGDALLDEISVEVLQVESHIVAEHMEGRPSPYTCPKVDLEGVEAIAGVGSIVG